MAKKIDKEKLVSHLKTKWTHPCPLCGVAEWNVSDGVFELREFSDGNMILGGVPIIPVVPVTCNNCGNTVLLNALTVKLIKPPLNI